MSAAKGGESVKNNDIMLTLYFWKEDGKGLFAMKWGSLLLLYTRKYFSRGEVGSGLQALEKAVVGFMMLFTCKIK